MVDFFSVFAKSCHKSQIILTVSPFIKLTKGEDIQEGWILLQAPQSAFFFYKCHWNFGVEEKNEGVTSEPGKIFSLTHNTQCLLSRWVSEDSDRPS